MRYSILMEIDNGDVEHYQRKRSLGDPKYNTARFCSCGTIPGSTLNCSWRCLLATFHQAKSAVLPCLNHLHLWSCSHVHHLKAYQMNAKQILIHGDHLSLRFSCESKAWRMSDKLMFHNQQEKQHRQGFWLSSRKVRRWICVFDHAQYTLFSWRALPFLQWNLQSN